MSDMQIHTEFENVDGRTFVTGSTDALSNLFGRDLKRDVRQMELGKTAQRLATVFAALKSKPASITVRVPTEIPDLPNSEARRSVCKYVNALVPFHSPYILIYHLLAKGLPWISRHNAALGHTAAEVSRFVQRWQFCRDLGSMVQDKLSKWALSDATLFSGGACDLIILDRGHDPVAPVIHPFHYAAITHDLVPLANGVFKYSWQNAQGEQQSSEHVVDSTDPMWAELRHAHIAEVVQVASARLKDFTHSRLARVERAGVLPSKSDLPHQVALKCGEVLIGQAIHYGFRY